MKISIKSQKCQKQTRKRPNPFLKKARKKQNFICGIAILYHKKASQLQKYQKSFLEIRIKSCMALYWSTDLS